MKSNKHKSYDGSDQRMVVKGTTSTAAYSVKLTKSRKDARYFMLSSVRDSSA